MKTRSLLNQSALLAKSFTVAAVALIFSPSLQATDRYWDSDGTVAGGSSTSVATGTWGSSNFWNSDSTGGAGGSFTATTTSSDDLFFSAGADVTSSYTVTVAASTTQSANKITVEEGTMTISGNAATSSISLGSGGVTLQSTAGGLNFGSTTATANTPITIAAAQTWTNNHASANITVSSGLTINNLLTLGAGGAAWSGGSEPGAIVFQFGTGAGNGGVRINGAAVAVNSSATTPFGTGTLQLSSGNIRPTTTTDTTVTNSLLIDGNFMFRTSTSSGRHLIFTGGGAISNAPTLTLSDTTGSGTQFTTGAITLNSDVTFNGAGVGLISSSIGQDATPRGLTYAGSSTLTLSGANSYTGNTTVSRGTLLVDLVNNPTGVISSSSALRLGTGTTFTVKGNSTGTSSQTVAGLILDANTSSTISINPNSGSGTTLTLGNTWTRNAGSTLSINLATTGTKTLTSSPTTASGTNGVLGYALVTDATSTGFARVSGGNIVRLTGAGTLANTTNDSLGDYALVNTSANIVHAAGNWAVNSLEFANTGNATLNLGGGILNVASGGVLWRTNGGNLLISNGQLGASDSELIFHKTATQDIGTISAVISGGTGSFTKAGAGNITLTGSSSYTGNTVIRSGTLQVGAGGIDGSISASSNVINDGALILSRSDVVSFNNVISGTGILTKSGAGTTTLSATNTYSGATTVQSGKLVVSGSIGNSAVTVTGTNTTLASGTTGTIGSSVTINNGAILAAGDTNAIGTATVTNGTAFNTSSIFSWDLNASGAGTVHDIVNTTSVTGDNSAIFRIVLGTGQNFAEGFWNTSHSWSDVFTGSVSNLASVFGTRFEYQNNGGAIAGPSVGSFTFNGSTLEYNFSAVPEPTSAIAGLLLGAGLLRRRRA